MKDSLAREHEEEDKSLSENISQEDAIAASEAMAEIENLEESLTLAKEMEASENLIAGRMPASESSKADRMPASESSKAGRMPASEGSKSGQTKSGENPESRQMKASESTEGQRKAGSLFVTVGPDDFEDLDIDDFEEVLPNQHRSEPEESNKPETDVDPGKPKYGKAAAEEVKLQKRKRNLKIAGIVLAAAELYSSYLLCCMVSSLELVPMRYILMLGIVLGLIGIGSAYFVLRGRRVSRTVAIILLILATGTALLGIYYSQATKDALDSITNADECEDVDIVYLTSLTGSGYTKIDQFGGHRIGIMKTQDRKNTDKVAAGIDASCGQRVTYLEYEGLADLVQALYDQEVDAIIYNNATLDLITEQFEDFEDGTHVVKINTFAMDGEEEDYHAQVKENPLLKNQAFAIYLSGIDTYGEISKKSRSDVNIIAVLNPVSRQVLLVTTPRDYYVPLPSWVNENCPEDKLTHAGIYGIKASMDTLENLYDINIDYYLRVNFTGFIDIVDALNGVNVYSEQSFLSEVGKYNFTKGINHVNGKMALGFVRERHSFKDGDFQRARNQMAMIEAVLDKATSPSILMSYADVMKSLKGALNTSLSADDLGTLVNMQLDDDRPWKVTTYATGGTNARRKTYSMGSRSLFVVLPDTDAVEKAKLMIDRVENGLEPEETTSEESSSYEESGSDEESASGEESSAEE